MANSMINISIVICLIGFAFVLLPSCDAQNTQQDYLRVHNEARADVNVPLLDWDDNLAGDAQLYLTANVLGLCTLNANLYSNGLNVQVGDVSLTGSAAVDIWVSQKPNYDHTTNSCVGGTCIGYVQVVWSRTVRVGCFRAQCLNNNLLWVVGCRYSPASFYPGDYAY